MGAAVNVDLTNRLYA